MANARSNPEAGNAAALQAAQPEQARGQEGGALLRSFQSLIIALHKHVEHQAWISLQIFIYF